MKYLPFLLLVGCANVDPSVLRYTHVSQPDPGKPQNWALTEQRYYIQDQSNLLAENDTLPSSVSSITALHNP